MNQDNEKQWRCPSCGVEEGCLHDPECPWRSRDEYLHSLQRQPKTADEYLRRFRDTKGHAESLRQLRDRLERQARRQAISRHEWVTDELRVAPEPEDYAEPEGGPTPPPVIHIDPVEPVEGMFITANPPPMLNFALFDKSDEVGRFWFDETERRWCFKGDASDAAQSFIDNVLSILQGEVERLLGRVDDEEADRRHRAEAHRAVRAAIYGR